MIEGRPLHDAASMRAYDHAAIAAGIASASLMEAAGTAVADAIQSRYPTARRIVAVCASGNNGGDGFVAARVLFERGVSASCVLITNHPLRGDARAAADAAGQAGVHIDESQAVSSALAEAEVVIDALTGTGFHGAPREDLHAAIHAVCDQEAPVVSVDVPSGVDASTGEVATIAVTAAVTVTFHAEKIGLYVAPGLVHAGEVQVVPIGIPDDVAAPAPARIVGVGALDALPSRSRIGSKYDAGSVLVIGGSTGLTGAVSLASQAALRAGAGIVTAACPASLNAVLEAKLTEPITLPLPDTAGAITEQAAPLLIERATRIGAVVLGPGIGRHDATQAFVRAVIAPIDAPLVVDADGLFALGREPERLAARTAATIITPHAGEAARLLGRDREWVAAHRLAAARELASRADAVCLLKGADTLIVTPRGDLLIRDGECAALATAGTGDVLAGTIAALLGRGAAPLVATAAAAYAHLLAARAAASQRPGRAIIAGDLVEQLALG